MRFDKRTHSQTREETEHSFPQYLCRSSFPILLPLRLPSEFVDPAATSPNPAAASPNPPLHFPIRRTPALPHPLRPLRFPIRCGLPKSAQESPNGGASKGTSPPSSPLEQKPADPCRPGTRRQARSSYTRRSSCTRQPSSPLDQWPAVLYEQKPAVLYEHQVYLSSAPRAPGMVCLCSSNRFGMV